MVHYGSAGSLIRLTQNASYLLNAQGYGDDDGIQWCAGLMRSGKQLEAISKLMSGHLPTETSDNILGYLDSTINVNNQTSTSSVFLFDTGQPKNFATVTAPLASFLAIPLTATPSDLYRSILEGFGYRIRESAEKYNLISDKIRWYGAGGGIQSNVWCQIVTDIVGKVQRVCPDADSAIGGALIAGSACNLFDLEKVINQRIIHSRLYQPQRHLQSAYDMQYQKFLFVSQLLQQYRDRYS